MQQILPTVQELVTKWKREPNVVEVSCLCLACANFVCFEIQTVEEIL